MTVNLVRYQPFSELASLRRTMDRFFDERFFVPYRFFTTPERLTIPIDLHQTENEVVLKATLPGVKPEAVEVSVTGDTLTIKGETSADKMVERAGYLYREHRYGAFSRSVALPGGLDTDKAEASLADGILTLTIPKIAELKPTPIKVKTKASTRAKARAKGTAKGKK